MGKPGPENFWEPDQNGSGFIGPGLDGTTRTAKNKTWTGPDPDRNIPVYCILLMKSCLESVLESLVFKKCTSRHVKRTSGARVMTFVFNELGLSITQSIKHTPWNNENVRLFGLRISISRIYFGGVRISNFFFRSIYFGVQISGFEICFWGIIFCVSEFRISNLKLFKKKRLSFLLTLPCGRPRFWKIVLFCI